MSCRTSPASIAHGHGRARGATPEFSGIGNTAFYLDRPYFIRSNPVQENDKRVLAKHHSWNYTPSQSVVVHGCGSEIALFLSEIAEILSCIRCSYEYDRNGYFNDRNPFTSIGSSGQLIPQNQLRFNDFGGTLLGHIRPDGVMRHPKRKRRTALKTTNRVGQDAVKPLWEENEEGQAA